MTSKEMIFVVGAHKAATTSVATWLAEHPRVALARDKEPNTFAERSVGRENDPYWELFVDRPVLVDASTNYSICSVFPGCAARIAATVPQARIVYLTRDPLSRITSAWRQHLDESGYPIAPSLARAVREDPALVDATLYHQQLSEYLLHFPRDQIFTMPMEQLVTSEAARSDLASFAGLGDLVARDLPRSNEAQSKLQDGVVGRAVLTSRVGARVADQLRASRWRGPLAGLRRRYLMTESPPPDIIDLDQLDDADRIRADGLAYLELVGQEPEIWPSLVRGHTTESCSDSIDDPAPGAAA